MINKFIITEFNYLIDYFQYKMNKIKTYKDKQVYIYKIGAIQNAIIIIKSLNYDLSIKENLKKFSEIKGIGNGILKRVNQIIKYNYLPEIKNFKQKQLKKSDLYDIYGIGEQTIYYLQKQKINNVKELKDAIKYKTISNLPDSIIIGLKYYKKFKEHIMRDEMNYHNEFLNKVVKSLNKNLILTICGSYRRGNEYSNDIDCILTNKKEYNPEDFNLLINTLINCNYIVDEITKSRNNKVMAFCLSFDVEKKELSNKIIRRIDFIYIPYEEYSSALLYFTGDKYFNQHLRKYAKLKGFRLNEHGLFDIKTLKKIPNLITEKDIFNYLKYPFIKLNNRQYRRYMV